jgi:hypothetical protein
MAIEGATCIVRCIQKFRDGNCVIKDAGVGEEFEIPQPRLAQLLSSGPDSWEVLETRIPKSMLPRAPKKEVAEEIVEWKPVGWYAAQLAKGAPEEEQNGTSEE